MEAEEARETEAAEALAAQKGSVTGPTDEEGLAEFSRMLSVFTHCGRLKVIAQLLRPSNQHSSSILSSIEFDRDSEVHLSFPHPTWMYHLDPWLHYILSARAFGLVHLSSTFTPACGCSQPILGNGSKGVCPALRFHQHAGVQGAWQRKHHEHSFDQA